LADQPYAIFDVIWGNLFWPIRKKVKFDHIKNQIWRELILAGINFGGN